MSLPKRNRVIRHEVKGYRTSTGYMFRLNWWTEKGAGSIASEFLFVIDVAVEMLKRGRAP